ncbi:MAG: SseB family protein [Firmicutes bacterium]|nr:SseB family protein [Bacillota bacterium]
MSNKDRIDNIDTTLQNTDPFTDGFDPLMQYNPLIEEKIEEYHQDPTNPDSIHSVLQAILQAMVMEGHVLVPVETPEEACRIFDPEKIKKGDVITVEEELHWKLIHLTYEDGSAGMPIFTSREKMDEIELHCSTIDTFMDEYFSQVLEMENMKGIVVNPGERGFFLSKEIIQALLDEKDMRWPGTIMLYDGGEKHGEGSLYS